jgi:hypothetical protein
MCQRSTKPSSAQKIKNAAEYPASSLFFQCHVLSHGNKGPGNVSERIAKNMHEFGKGEISKKEKCKDDVEFVDKRSTCNH